MDPKSIAIIGAGPIGLEAALYARQLNYDVTVFERDRVGAHLLDWGHVTFFSPWSMNHSPLGESMLQRFHKTLERPSPDDYLTGKEYVQAYLEPLSELPQLSSSIQLGAIVETIGKQGLLKGDLIGNVARAEFPFRILTADMNGVEKAFQADIVIDASGVYRTPNWLGQGGIPALGERRHASKVDYHIVDVYGTARARFAGQKTLLVGSGYSAATTACAFQNLIREEPATRLIWAIRGERSHPISAIPDDPLPNRARLTRTANQLSQNVNQQIAVMNNGGIESIEYSKDKDTFSVKLHSERGSEKIVVDRIIANVGYGPDNAIYRELQVHECYASRGPMKLAAALLGSASTDCLTQTSMGPDSLRNPEPNFFIIGNKSYGRNSTFLLQIGFSQIVEVFSLITGDKNLNLYKRLQSERTTNAQPKSENQ